MKKTRSFTRALALALLSSFVLLPPSAPARSLGKAVENSGFEILGGHQMVPDSVADDLSFAMVGAEGGEEKRYRLYNISPPEGAAALEEAKRELGQVIGRERIAIYSSGETVEDEDGNVFHLVFVNTARGLLTHRLMEEGLVGLGGEAGSLPDGTAAAAYRDELVEAFDEAEEQERGMFGEFAPAEADGKVNINTCTKEELMALPGIGDATALQIMRARPIRSVTRLQRVDGIGPVTYGELRRLVKVRD